MWMIHVVAEVLDLSFRTSGPSLGLVFCKPSVGLEDRPFIM